MRGGILRGPASVVSPGIWKAAGGPQARQTQGAAKFAHHDPSSGISAKKLPQHAPKRPFWNIFAAPGELFRAHAPAPGRAGRQISHTGHTNMARLKPTTPLLTPNKGPLKPASPLRPTTAPKTPISHLQRRRRFQSHTDTSKQRRRWFQTTGSPRQQGQAAAPAGGGWAWPGFEPTRPATRKHTRPYWCGGSRKDRRRDRRALAGFEAPHHLEPRSHRHQTGGNCTT